MALAAVRTSGDLCGKSARPYGRGCRVASGNKGKSVVIQLFPRDETGMVVGNSDSEGEQRKTTLRALSLSISGRAILEEQEGRRAIRIDASFCLNYYLPPFFFSLFLSLHPLSLHPLLFFLPPLLLFSQTSSPPIRDPTRSSLIPANRRLYWLFTLVTSLPHRRWILVGAISLSLKSNFARHRTPRGRTMWFTHRHRLNYRSSS